MLTVIVLALVGGIAVGGIINWLADQLPALISVDDVEGEPSDPARAKVQAYAHTRLGLPCCMTCGTRLRPSQYLGLSASLLRQRNCTNCGHPLSMRHAIVELLVSLLGAYLIVRAEFMPSVASILFYAAVFVLIAVIDIEHRLVLNSVMLPAFVVAFIEIVLAQRIRLRDALIGYALGQIVVMGLYLLGAVYLWFVNLRRREQVTEVAFGFGDVTLATFCGLVVGFPSVIYMMVLMILLGGIIALAYLVYHALVRRNYQAHTPFAYGPAIVLAAFIVMLLGDRAIFPAG